MLLNLTSSLSYVLDLRNEARERAEYIHTGNNARSSIGRYPGYCGAGRDGQSLGCPNGDVHEDDMG